MPYIQKILSKDEKIVGVTNVHWIYLVQGALFFFVMHLIGTALQWIYQYGVGTLFSGGISGRTAVMLLQIENYFLYPFWLLGASYLIPMVIKYLTTEIGLTDKRLIEKNGWISVQISEFDVKEIYGATVDTGMLGRIFGYGFVQLDCRFINDITTAAIPHPHKLVGAINDVREKVMAGIHVSNNDTAMQDIDDASAPASDTPQEAERPESLTLDIATPAPDLDADGKLATPEADALAAAPPAVATDPVVSVQDIKDAIAAAIPQIAHKVAEELSHGMPHAPEAAPKAGPAPSTAAKVDSKAAEQDMADELAINFDDASSVHDLGDAGPKPMLQ
ncbi:MAG: PH domain-containing protein [Pseudomonadota bacterium]